MNQGKLEVVKQEMARANVDILGLSKQKWTGMGGFNSNDHYIYYCGQESLRRNGVAIVFNKRVWNAIISVQFSCSVVSDSLKPHGQQHARLPCPSPSPRVFSDSCRLSWWCHPTISSSVTPFPSCPQSFPASESFPMRRLFTSGGQRIGASSSASVFRVDFLENGLVGSPCCPRGSQESSPAPQFESINSLVLSLLYGPTLTSIQDYWKKPSCWQIDVFDF